jgi:gamma-glutamylcyclotransferase (GGCT)/AIG2-like uncharacterized protein YtfP
MSNLFVYGTLMSRYQNPIKGTIGNIPEHSFLDGFDHIQAWVDDYILYWLDNLDFPFIVPYNGKKVIGELYYDVDLRTLDELDIFEGVSAGHFERNNLNIHTIKGTEEAFAYVGGSFLKGRFNNTPGYETVIVPE